MAEQIADESWSKAIGIWTRSFNQVNSLVFPVFVNLLFTLAAWVYVYEMRVEDSPIAMLFLDPTNVWTTGNDFYDGMLNGFICVASVAVLSFIMLGFAMYDFRRLIQCWLSMSCLLIMFCVSANFFTQLLLKFSITNLFAIGILTLVYGIVGTLAFFTDKLPLAFHQFYVICNCSLVSLFYLQILPNHTTWFLLACIVIWDIFAVLTPMGPLRQVTNKAQDYSEDILRFLMFTTKTERLKQEMEDELEPNEDDDCKTAESISDEAVDKIEVKRTAQDALNDSSARLGMGDFVFYSLLVGKAAVSGSFLATVAAIVGVVTGLIVTLTVLTSDEETTPALPVSIFLGMVLYFGTLHLGEPMLRQVILI